MPIITFDQCGTMNKLAWSFFKSDHFENLKIFTYIGENEIFEKTEIALTAIKIKINLWNSQISSIPLWTFFMSYKNEIGWKLKDLQVNNCKFWTFLLNFGIFNGPAAVLDFFRFWKNLAYIHFRPKYGVNCESIKIGERWGASLTLVYAYVYT